MRRLLENLRLRWLQMRSEAAKPASFIADVGAPATEERLRELMGLALSTPTPEAIFAFVDFSSRMKRLGAYNMLMVYAQRPGAVAVASRKEWKQFGQTVCPDAIPILILHPRGPISYVYELSDTTPPQHRDPREHPLAAAGPFEPERFEALTYVLAHESKRKLRVYLELEDFGGELAGQITKLQSEQAPESGLPVGSDRAADAISRGPNEYAWRIKINRRLEPSERFATLLHELAHLFCGHVGRFGAETPSADEYGWPDRRHLAHELQEIEAELVAWHICEREGLITGSPLYLKPHLEKARDRLGEVDIDRVIRAIARVCHYIQLAERHQRERARRPAGRAV